MYVQDTFSRHSLEPSRSGCCCAAEPSDSDCLKVVDCQEVLFFAKELTDRVLRHRAGVMPIWCLNARWNAASDW